MSSNFDASNYDDQPEDYYYGSSESGSTGDYYDNSDDACSCFATDEDFERTTEGDLIWRRDLYGPAVHSAGGQDRMTSSDWPADELEMLDPNWDPDTHTITLRSGRIVPFLARDGDQPEPYTDVLGPEGTYTPDTDSSSDSSSDSDQDSSEIDADEQAFLGLHAAQGLRIARRFSWPSVYALTAHEMMGLDREIYGHLDPAEHGITMSRGELMDIFSEARSVWGARSQSCSDSEDSISVSSSDASFEPTVDRLDREEFADVLLASPVMTSLEEYWVTIRNEDIQTHARNLEAAEDLGLHAGAMDLDSDEEIETRQTQMVLAHSYDGQRPDSHAGNTVYTFQSGGTTYSL